MAGPDTSGGVPPLLAMGVPMLKVSSKKIKPVIVHLSPTTITWPSLKGGKVEIKSIRELRLGQSPTDAYDGARWITLVYVRDKQWKMVHFIAHTDDVYGLWVDALRELVSADNDKVVSGATGPANDPDLLFIRQLWPAGTTAVDKATATSMCGQLGLSVTPAFAAQYSFPIDVTRFRQLVRDLQTRPELTELHSNLGGDMTREAVQAFLLDVQGEDVDQVAAVYDKWCNDKGLWTVDSLAHYLASPDNVHKTEHDLTHPLTEYFIASSHNTYLVADQWRGASTVDGYIRVLLAGCRCVEVDCHNGDVEPEVYHAKTITSSVPVRSVFQAIKKYAFVASPYPVIISLEVRCSMEQQDRMAAILVEIFGDILVTLPLADVKGYPSPEDLKGRVLVKAKAAVQPPPPPIPAPARLSPPTSSPPPPQHHDSTDSTTESDSSFVRLARRLSLSTGGDKNKPPGSSSISRRLSELAVYAAGVKYRGFSKLVTYEPFHMFSVSERTANRIIREGQEPDWIKHNYTHLTRVYPKGVRLTSTNFEPQPYWGAGTQLVAINYQTHDRGSLLNHALFQDSGYVLKPISLRQKTAEVPERFVVRVKIISAQRLPPTPDLYVEGTVGVQTWRTKAVRGASLSPRWDETLEFVVETKRSCLALTFVTLEIRSRNLVAQWVRPLTDVGRGYRYLPLDDQARSRYLFATLFVRIDVRLAPPPRTDTRTSTSSAASRQSSKSSFSIGSRGSGSGSPSPKQSPKNQAVSLPAAVVTPVRNAAARVAQILEE